MSYSNSNYVLRTFTRAVIYFFTFRFLTALFPRKPVRQHISVYRGHGIIDEISEAGAIKQGRIEPRSFFYYLGVLFAVAVLSLSVFAIYQAVTAK
jgi:hypothetical protein